MAALERELVTGYVKWFDEAKGYGFISAPNFEKDIFVHFSGISGTGRRNLAKGDNVEFYVEESKMKPGHMTAVEVIKLA